MVEIRMVENVFHDHDLECHTVKNKRTRHLIAGFTEKKHRSDQKIRQSVSVCGSKFWLPTQFEQPSEINCERCHKFLIRRADLLLIELEAPDEPNAETRMVLADILRDQDRDPGVQQTR